MSRTVQLAVFFLIMSTVTGGVHFYLWLRLVRDPMLPAPWRAIATATIVVLALLIPASFFARRFLGFTPQALYWVVMLWLGTMFLLFVFVLGADVVRLGAWILEKLFGDKPTSPERRLFFSRLLGGGIAGTVAVLTATAIRAVTRLEVKRIRVPLARLPRALHGTRIVQITDIHVGPTVRRDFVQTMVDKVNALEPDVIAITGDLVDGTVAELGHHTEPLAQLRAKHGVYFVTGNHEYYAGVTPWLAELERLGIRVLRNERVSIGSGEDSFDLAGVDDWNSRGFPGHGHDLASAVAGRDPGRELVLLAHQPRAIHDAAKHGVGLQLSGHTHGGQIWPWGYFVYLQQPYVAGLSRHLDRTWIYVSDGTGYWGPPMRLGSIAEITEVVLEAAPLGGPA